MSDKYVAVADGVALTAATPKTVLQIATPSTIRARVCEVVVGFDGVTASDAPVLVELVRQTSAGTGTAVTPLPLDPAAPASLPTALKNHSAEPSGPTVLRAWRVTPAGGLFVVPFIGDEQPVVGASGWLGVRCTAAVGVNANAQLVYLA
jgi:hypothetical protein